ncbi:pyruvate ferredoxin oxidoreductase [candidate division TA06 bacterium DG_24]|jgi:2-oxoglutarate ferredoxin oxidoreductase subunit gamma|uniref:Pyruvate ferredoxin oxidoreductase n=3 Tax=Bacteria division TA06 TaxID=1156500 RepID=A0A0S8JKT6_UNCT6|nr:MAG: pyruvate ferredoxin oxidoreductase [candidate division TA06 bacterium DG_24]KPK67715.1 MAG: pyruvate ferredoxin oxidoreductase [candidate division TA06 bacterium SM23_40]KPL10377.1 MAG: pyruvate ferredoxin oxidoreductase [candidate division TA06 bacterium SM1_40]
MAEIRVTGFGGQGIIRLGYIIGKAASLYGQQHATLTQSFGPEARGSACSAQVVVSDMPVLYPYITRPDILVAMSQEAYGKYIDNLKEGGQLLFDQDLVSTGELPKSVKAFSIPATRLAEEMGNRIIANIVMLGFFTAVTGLIEPEAVRKAIPGSVPDRFVELNQKAFDVGYNYVKEGAVVAPPEDRS